MPLSRWVIFSFSLCMVALASGCETSRFSRTVSEEQMFAPASMRIHPTFTQVKDWTGDNKPDGVEVVLELQDPFDEPTRAAGTVRFELWGYHESAQERKGKRETEPWFFPLTTRAEQTAHWNPVERGYTFQLPFDKISADHRYVLTAQFDRPEGRLFDQLILEPADGDTLKRNRHTERAPTRDPGR